MMREMRERLANGYRPPPDDSGAEKEQVEKILGDTALRDILMDPAVQAALQEAGRPGGLGRVMGNPDMAPKIKMLIDAGCVRLEGA